MPVALYGITAGCIMAILCSIAHNVYRNVSEMRRGQSIPFNAAFLLYHTKRPGERFAMREKQGPLYTDDDVNNTIKTTAGNLFEPAASGGKVVSGSIPLVPYMAAGICAVALFVLWPAA